MKNVFIISGPSGAGEDSIINGLEKFFEIERVLTTTTREMRPGEYTGKPYYFISKEDFNRKIEQGDFIEYALQYNGNLYGVTKNELDRVSNSGKIGIWKIEYKGVMAVKKLFPEIKSILINTPDLETLERRIKLRDGASDAYIQERMEYTKEWLNNKNIYDYEIINRDNYLNNAIEETVKIIKSNIIA